MYGFDVVTSGAYSGGLLKNNTFASNTLGNLGYTGAAGTGATEPLIEDNYGIDLQCTYPTLPTNYTYPAVVAAKRFNVQYGAPRNLDDLRQGCWGKEVWLFFKNSNTNVLFSTSTTLKGNGGVDFAAVSGDVMKAVKGDDGNWYCELISVSKPLPSQLSGTLTWDPGLIAVGAGETSNAITVTGAALGDYVIVSAPYDLQSLTCSAYVSAANTVRIRLHNGTAGGVDLGSGVWKVKTLK